MKKKSILLLLVALTLSLVFGLVGCTIVEDIDNGNNQVEVSEEDKTKFALIVEKNEVSDVVAENENYVVIYDFNDGEVAGYHAEIVFINDGGAYSSNYILTGANGEVLAATNIGNGERYSIDASGEAVYGIYSGTDYNQHALSLGAIDFSEQVLAVGMTDEEGVLRFSTTSANGDEEVVDTVVNYDWEVDAETLLIKGLVRTVVDAENNVIENVVIAFGYNVEGCTPNLIAYETITDENAEKVELTVLYNPSNYTWEYEKTYVVAKGTEIVFEVAADGTSYSFYENISCTRDIESIKEIYEYYGDVAVYAAPSKEQISFKFTLSDADVEEMETLIENYLALVDANYPIDEIEMVRSFIEDKMGYFVHMYYVGQIEYYRDITKAEGQEAMTYAQTTYNDMYKAYIDAYRAIYELDDDNEYKQYFFIGWTEEDYAIFEQDNDALAELEEANSNIEMQYNALNQNDAEWSFKVEQLYEQLVANNQQIAALNGYANAYEYYASTVYDRHYTAEERRVLTTSIKKYVVDYYNQAMDAWNQLRGSLLNNDITRYNSAMYNNLRSLDNEYIGGYINSFEGSLNKKMRSMYEKNAIVFANSTSSQSSAFANYSSYYGEGFTYFGKDRQELMTIIHEMGHYISFESYSLSNMGYDLAETHSQGNEWLMLAYLKKNMQKKTFNITKTLRMVNGFSSIVAAMLVDEFEYRVYTAETPYVAGEFRDVMAEVLFYFGINEKEIETYYDGYAQIVTILSPVYYLNYVTSEIASMGFYAIAEQQGYEVAQEVYRRLQEDCDITKPYGQILQDIGLSSPFVEQTYIDLGEVFFG